MGRGGREGRGGDNDLTHPLLQNFWLRHCNTVKTLGSSEPVNNRDRPINNPSVYLYKNVCLTKCFFTLLNASSGMLRSVRINFLFPELLL